MTLPRAVCAWSTRVAATRTNELVAQTKITPAFETSPTQVNLSLFWELDCWGRYRRATEAARARLLNSIKREGLIP